MTYPPSIRHQEFLQDIFVRLDQYFDNADHIRGKLLLNPVAVQVDEIIIQPDLLILLEDRFEYISPYYIKGPPNIVVDAPM